MRATKLSVVFAAGLAACTSAPPSGSKPGPMEEEPDADAPARPVPDAARQAADAAAPAMAPPDSAADPDVATPPADSAPTRPADADAPGPDGGSPVPMGMRLSLADALAAKWTQARETITEEGGMKVFTGTFEANKFGGPQGHTPRLPLKPGHEYLFEYKIRFNADFPFTRGGKIPGLAGGNAPTGCVDTDANGFSARMMWRQNGQLIGYLYDQDQGGDCGNNITTTFDFKPGQWYALKERVRLNTGRNHDGILQIWVDDRLLIDRKNMEYMVEAPGNLINVVLFHSFFGGSTQDWAPARQCSISFAEPFATLLAE
jgi:hypothetical protein